MRGPIKPEIGQLSRWLMGVAIMIGALLAVGVLSLLQLSHETGQLGHETSQTLEEGRLQDSNSPISPGPVQLLADDLLAGTGVMISELSSPVLAVSSETTVLLSKSWIAREQRPVLMNFWGTWCKPCIDEMGLMSKLAAKYHRSVIFAGVAYELDLRDPNQQVRDQLQKHGIGYANYVVREEELARSIFQKPQILYPAFALFDATGELRFRTEGSLRSDDLLRRLELAIAAVLSGPATSPKPNRGMEADSAAKGEDDRKWADKESVEERRVTQRVSEQGDGLVETAGLPASSTAKATANSLLDCLGKRESYTKKEKKDASFLAGLADSKNKSFLSALLKPTNRASIALINPLALEYARNDFSPEEFDRMLLSLKAFGEQNKTGENSRNDLTLTAYIDPTCSACGEALQLLKEIQSDCGIMLPLDLKLVQEPPVTRQAGMLEALRSSHPDSYNEVVVDLVLLLHLNNSEAFSAIWESLTAKGVDIQESTVELSSRVIVDRHKQLREAPPAVSLGAFRLRKDPKNWPFFNPLKDSLHLKVALIVAILGTEN